MGLYPDAKRAYAKQTEFAHPVLPEPTYRVDYRGDDAAVVLVDLAHNRIIPPLSEVSGQRLLVLMANHNDAGTRQVLHHVAQAVMRQNAWLNRVDIDRMQQLVKTHLSLERRFAGAGLRPIRHEAFVVMYDRVYALHLNEKVLCFSYCNKLSEIAPIELAPQTYALLRHNNTTLLTLGTPRARDVSASTIKRWSSRLAKIPQSAALKKEPLLKLSLPAEEAIVAIQLHRPNDTTSSSPLWLGYRHFSRKKQQLLIILFFSWIMALCVSLVLNL